MKTTKRKFSLGVKIASILSCVAVLSVGFASWLIVNVPTETNNTIGSFEVYEVKEKSVTLAYDWGADSAPDKDGEDNYTDAATTAAKIIFGKPASGTATNNWLRPEDGMANEKLTAKVKVTVGNYDQLTNFSVSIDASAFSGIDTLVGTPTVSYMNADGSGSVDTDDTAGLSKAELTAAGGVVVVVFTFSWGAEFTPANAQDPVNPFFFYNNQKYSAEIASEAKTNLTNLKTALTNAKYSVTFTCQ